MVNDEKKDGVIRIERSAFSDYNGVTNREHTGIYLPRSVPAGQIHW